MQTMPLVIPPLVRVVAVLCLLGATATPLGQAQVSFYQTPTYAGTAAVIGDFNQDGKLDIINSAGTVLLGKGDGTFITGTTLSNAPSFVADFNGDDKADVLAFTSSNHLLVYLGNGDGTFQPAQDTYAAVPLAGMAVADLVTGVNEADVLVPNPMGGVLVYLGKGDGTFAAPVNYPSPVLGQLFIGDFNGDGKPDVLGTSYGLVSVLLGNGDGTLQAAKTTTSSALGFVQAVGDLNGDQKPDLVVSGNYNYTQMATMLGNGDGTFQSPGDGFYPISISSTLADINGDGKLDLLVQSFPFLQVYLGNGDGSFTVGQSYSYNSVDLTNSNNILVGDFNGDGKPDITAAQSILFGNGDGSFQASPAVLPPSDFVQFVQAAVSGDFNGDGRSDLAVVDASGNVDIYLASAAGTPYLAHIIPAALWPVGFWQTGDFNGDGILDLIAIYFAADGAELQAVLLGNGDGSFGAPVSSGACQFQGLSGALADLNGDHKADLAFPNGDSMGICLGNGDGTFTPTVNYFYGANAGSVVVADFNNDGKLDAAVGGNAGVAVFLGNGDGTFQSGQYLLTTPWNVGSAADFNRDGNTDLILNGIAGSSSSGQSIVYLGNGKGGFQLLTKNVMGLPTTVVDINGDGYLDLVGSYCLPQCGGKALGIFLGNGDGTFQAPIVLDNGNRLVSQGSIAADFKGDGRPDLTITWEDANGVPAGIQILLNTTPPPVDFGIGPAKGSSNSATITAGQTSSFNLAVSPIGSFSGMVSLNCTIMPSVAPAPVCTVPASVKVTQGTVASVTAMISTTASVTAGSISGVDITPGAIPWTIVLLGSGLLFSGYRRRKSALTFAVITVAFFTMVGCGGGSASTSNTMPGTPVGTYTATITAKSGTLGHNTTLTVIVQ